MRNLENKRIVVTGGAGFLGRHVCKKLIKLGVSKDNLIVPRSNTCDLRKSEDCMSLLQTGDIVIHLAAKVGGLWSHINKQADFFYDNAIMALNLVHAAHTKKVEKFIGLGSVCEYPDNASIPFREHELWEGYPSAITAPYGLAKKVLLTAGQTFSLQYRLPAIHLLMINLYGPGDDFNPETSHAIPAIINRVHNAIVNSLDYIDVWGDGTASRELLYVEDAAEAIVLATLNYEGSDPINVGSGVETSIRDLTNLICTLMDFQGEIRWDSSKVGGQLRRQLDVSQAKAQFGFSSQTPMELGLKNTIEWYFKNIQKPNST